MIYGGPLEDETTTERWIVPQLCELCVGHVAVYYDCSWWPATYVCQSCLTRAPRGPDSLERRVPDLPAQGGADRRTL